MYSLPYGFAILNRHANSSILASVVSFMDHEKLLFGFCLFNAFNAVEVRWFRRFRFDETIVFSWGQFLNRGTLTLFCLFDFIFIDVQVQFLPEFPLIIHVNYSEEVTDELQVLFLVQADTSTRKVICYCCVYFHIIV